MDEKYIARFWSRVEKTEGCWLWTAGTNAHGYGAIFCGGRTGQMVRAHRFSWLVHFGDPGKLSVCHRCDNPPCVRPEHLFLDTHSANMQDKMRKGRAAMSHLSQDDIRQIRVRINSGESMYTIADSYSVNQALIWRISKRLVWAWVE
jgi:hypothetical protein